MAVTIIRGTNKKPASSDALVEFFEKMDGLKGHLFLGYPIISTSEGMFAIDAIWLTPNKGIVIFDLVEGKDLGDYQDRQDAAANYLEAKLKLNNELVSRRKLLTQISTISFAPAVASFPEDPDYFTCNLKEIELEIDKLDDWENGKKGILQKTLSAIQNISSIRKSRTKRQIEGEDTKGAKLKALEDSIATLDAQQGKAVVETVQGVQRIRGLAGSGKTIVLALKAAYLHAQHPEWKIVVTFNTRSLKGQFQRLINTFCIEQTGEEPDWENLKIIHAWGAPGIESKNGIYYDFCRTHDLPYYDYGTALNKFGRDQGFAGACQEALSSVTNISSKYDAILVDEAQDFPPVFLKLCYDFLDENKQLVYAYDELQNLSGESLPSPEQIFGVDENNEPNVRFEAAEKGKPKQDLLLDKCYRNSRPVLTTAHSLGFGIYRTPPEPGDLKLVQMFDHPGLWQEVGYQVKSGELREGRDVVLERTNDSSPLFLEEHSGIDDLLEFHCFKSANEQEDWLVNDIMKNLTTEELRHDDMIVINPDPITTRSKVGPIRRALFDKNISSHLAGVDTSPDVFFQTGEQSITFTGIFRAKGNEAGMVYIINAQDCHASTYNLGTIRNRIFTAITRSKGWVRVLGVGPHMECLINEFNELKRNNFELKFKYPTEKEREKLKIIHRDITPEERKRLDRRNRGVEEILKDLESGKLNREDLDQDRLDRLKQLLF